MENNKRYSVPSSVTCFRMFHPDKSFVTCGRYELYGVIAHSGRLASSGHYVAYVRDREADQQRADTAMTEAFTVMSRNAAGISA